MAALREHLRFLTGSDAREALAEYVDSTAGWRYGVAAEYPDDDRNARSAAALSGLAVWVRRLSVDDPRLARLAVLLNRHRLKEVTPSQEGSRITGRYGFDRGSDNADWWLGVFLETYLADDPAD